MYQMTSNGTRLRNDHTTYGAIILTVNYGTVVKGDILWTAPADGNQVKMGDQWLHVTEISGVSINQPGWMAYKHLGVYYATGFEELTDVPPPVPDPFPDYYVLTSPDGQQVRYNKV